MVAFHDAMKISSIPFPFPYTQATAKLLLLNYAQDSVALVEVLSDPLNRDLRQYSCYTPQ